jgi:diguanylate cyclase (GGDEF)-like protein/PAS domain S-box-containing protein
MTRTQTWQSVQTLIVPNEPAPAAPSVGDGGVSDRYERLYNLIVRLAQTDSFEEALGEILDTAMDLVHADAGYIRLVGSSDGTVPFVASRGFPESYIQYFQSLVEPVSPRNRSLILSGQRVSIEDVFVHPPFKRHLEQVIAAGHKSNHMLPLMSRGRTAVGGICVAFIERHTPTEDEFRTLELYASLAASTIERHQYLAAQARAEAASREAQERRFRILVDNAADLVTVIKPDFTILYQSPASERVLGRNSDDLVGSSIADLLHPDDLEALEAFLDEVGDDDNATHRDLRIRLQKTAGEWVYVEVMATDRRLDPEIAGFVLNARDVTARHLLEEELRYQANHDPLTGLANRRAFLDSLETALVRAADGGAGGALLLLDLDDFKDVNDSLGHQAGDSVLVELASLLRDEFGTRAEISRLGGDEFAILLPDTTDNGARTISRGLLDKLRARAFDTKTSGMINLTVTLGLVSYPRDGSTVDELMSRVDLALYEAKALGRNQVNTSFAFKRLEARAQSRLRLRHLIQNAIGEDKFRLHSQPILELESGQIAHHELLLRLKAKNGRLLPAKAFIDVAERSGTIVAIDRWVLGEAISLLANDSLPGNQSIAVNLSARSFSNSELSGWFIERLQAGCFDRERLIFEITERDAITNIDEAQKFMNLVKDLGCRFSLDDFGVGFSSLQMLRHLPLDYLKIDGSLIRPITRGVQDRELIRSVVGMAKALNMQTVAEFVERPEELGILTDLGVTLAQGYYIGRPRSVLKLAATAERTRSSLTGY